MSQPTMEPLGHSQFSGAGLCDPVQGPSSGPSIRPPIEDLLSLTGALQSVQQILRSPEQTNPRVQAATREAIEALRRLGVALFDPGLALGQGTLVSGEQFREWVAKMGGHIATPFQAY